MTDWICPCCQDRPVDGFRQFVATNPICDIQEGTILIIPMCTQCSELDTEEALTQVDSNLKFRGPEGQVLTYHFETDEGKQMIIPEELRPPPGYNP